MDRFSYKTDEEYEAALHKEDETDSTKIDLKNWCEKHPEEKECLIYDD